MNYKNYLNNYNHFLKSKSLLLEEEEDTGEEDLEGDDMEGDDMGGDDMGGMDDMGGDMGGMGGMEEPVEKKFKKMTTTNILNLYNNIFIKVSANVGFIIDGPYDLDTNTDFNSSYNEVALWIVKKPVDLEKYFLINATISAEKLLDEVNGKEKKEGEETEQDNAGSSGMDAGMGGPPKQEQTEEEKKYKFKVKIINIITKKSKVIQANVTKIADYLKEEIKLINKKRAKLLATKRKKDIKKYF